MNEQVSLFDYVDKEEKAIENEVLFQKWSRLSDKTFVPAGTPERERLLTDLRTGYGILYKKAQHICSPMPSDKYIWLNEVEEAEFWIMNSVGEVCGEKIDVCPFCGADLKHGEGDAVLVKAEPRFWAVNGFLKGCIEKRSRRACTDICGKPTVSAEGHTCYEEVP